MKIYNKILRYGIYPVMEKLMGTHTLKTLAELEKSQWWSPKKLKKLQEKRLRALIRHAYTNVPYYHRIFKERQLKPEDIRTQEDLRRLPILRKEDIRNNFEDMIAKNIERKNMEVQVTGGSTGVPLKFMRNKSALSYYRASCYRAYEWGGLDIFGDKWASLWGSPFDIRRRDDIKSKLYYWVLRQKILPMFAVSDETMFKYAEILKKFRPKMIRGFASTLYLFANFLERNDINYVTPNSVLSTAEYIPDYQKKYISEQFNCEVFDNYSSREFSIGQDCKEHMGFHISVENVVLECIKNDGEPVVSEPGRFIVTDLANYAMPLIRYENGDMGTLTDEMCTCGRGLPLIKSLSGRTSELIITPDDRMLTGAFFPHLFKDVLDGIKEYQIIQEKKDKLKLKLIKTENYSEKHLKYVLGNIKKYTGEDMEIDVEFVDEIPLARSGKRRAIISKIKIKF